MENNKKEIKTFSEFTNKYSLSKTLRFELKPVGKTPKMLEEAKVFEKDEIIQKKYEKTKPYFDKLHREFVDEALSGAMLTGLDEYFEVLKNWQKDKKNKDLQKAYEKKLQELRKEVAKKFDNKAGEWANKKYVSAGLKNKDTEILFEEAVFDLLKARYGEELESIIEVEEKDKNGKITIKQISIFDSWKGFTGYFTKFFETRRNFYKDDGTSTALATRIVDQNLKRFCDNIMLFENLKEKVAFGEVEKTFGIPLSQVFSLGFYNGCLLQDGINKYNTILGGETLENGEKRKGLNECINLHKQQTGEKLPFFKTLDKQILSEKNTFLDGIKDEAELLEALKQFTKTAEDKIKILRPLFADFVSKNEEYNLSQIYIEKKAFDPNSCKWIDGSAINNFQEALYEAMKSEKLAKYEKKDNSYKFPDFIALSYIKQALEIEKSEGNFWKEKYYDIAGFAEKTKWEQFLTIFSFEFNSLFERTITAEDGKEKQIGYSLFSKDFGDLIKKAPFTLSPQAKVTIKDFADSVLTVYQMAKYFAVEKKRAWLAEYELDSFYTHHETGYLRFYENAYEDIVQVYNDLRNYLTKKPYSEEKWKLNFDNSTLANGWPDSPEGNTQYCSFIFRKGKKYFLGITDFSKIFDQEKFPEAYRNDGEDFEKMVYKQVDAKTLYGSVYIGLFGTKYSDDQEKLNDQELLQKMKKVLETRVRFFPEFSHFIENINKGQYKDAKTLAREISDGAFYNISFVHVSKEYLWKGIYSIQKNQKGDTKEKKLYLFEIHNKDWNEGAKGSKNLHTIYFESLFSNENFVNNFPTKLNGQAEVFYRPKTKDLKKEKIITKVKKVILEKEEKAFQKNRYTENKIFFHVPITLQRMAESVPTQENAKKYFSYKFNSKINNFLANNSDINIIGVDRGEKHLAYYSVINQKQEIIGSGSLNEITGVNYAEKLEEKAKGREQARKDWQAVEGIKDLKKGYISQVVRKLADLAIKHNAIIVFEDLNMRFKQIRGGIEKSAYQQLEKALIEKLNFLVEKGETDPEKAGHLLRAYQLTAPFETFKEMGKQTGIIFYTQAAYTSRIDPITGWRPHLYLKYSSAEKAKTDISKFTKIEFVNGRFEFTYDIKNFRQDKEYPNNTIWTACSCVERFRWDKNLNQNKGGYTHYKNLTDGKAENKNPKSVKPNNLKELFEKYSIDISKDIKGQIEKLETKGNEKFFEHLIFFFNLICQIRNTQKEKNGDENDFILSPKEPFFDSRKAEKFGKNLPKNGDDNGAYNIARKGIIILKKITQFRKEKGNCDKMSWGDLYVSGMDWDNFAHNNFATDLTK